MKKIKSRECNMSDLSSYNRQTNNELLLNNSRNTADLFRFQHTINVENKFEVFKEVCKNSRQYLDYVTFVYMYL